MQVYREFFHRRLKVFTDVVASCYTQFFVRRICRRQQKSCDVFVLFNSRARGLCALNSRTTTKSSTMSLQNLHMMSVLVTHHYLHLLPCPFLRRVFSQFWGGGQLGKVMAAGLHAWLMEGSGGTAPPPCQGIPGKELECFLTGRCCMRPIGHVLSCSHAQLSNITCFAPGLCFPPPHLAIGWVGERGKGHGIQYHVVSPHVMSRYVMSQP